MYIDVVPNRNSPPAILLRESVREGNRTLKRTLANLSALPEEAVAALRVVLRGGRLVEAREQFAVERSLPCGHVQAVKLAMERLGMCELIGSKPCPEREVVLAMIAQRMIQPGSKLESAALFSDTTLAEEFGMEGVDENALYRAMDWLLGRQSFIERKLASRHLTEGSMVFYDVSSSSYHGSHCPLAQRGYNRDGLKLPGIVYGLLTDHDGRPVALRVYPGNTADPATVPDQIEAMRNEFGVGRFVMVGDQGMLTGAQIHRLREMDGCGWISCLRSGDVRKLVESRESTDGLPLRRWDGLLATLSTVVRNTCRIDEGKTPVRFTRDTEPNAFQARVFALLKAEATFWPNLVPSSRNAKTKTEVTPSC